MNPETQQLSRRTASMSDEEFAQRHRAASEEESRAAFPLIRWLCDAHTISVRTTMTQSLDGTVDVRHEYPPEVAEAMANTRALIETVRASIWAHYFPNP